VTVCGTGNEGHVFAAYAAKHSNGMIRMFKIHHINDTIREGNNISIVARHRTSSSVVEGHCISLYYEAKKAITDADMVILAVPATALQLYLEDIAPYLKSGALLGINAQAASAPWITRSVLAAMYDTVTVFYLLDVPWACRVIDPGRTVDVLGTKAVIDVVLQVFSGIFSHTTVSETGQQRTLPVLQLARSALPMALTISAVLHTGITYGHFCEWDGTTVYPTVPLFYHGVDESTVAVLEELEREGMAIVREISNRYPDKINVDTDGLSLHSWLKRAYDSDITDTSSLLSCLLTNAAYDGLAHPMVGSELSGYIPDISSRYWTEDLPCHLILAKGVASLLGNVETPGMDRVIAWMQRCNDSEYIIYNKLSGNDMCRSCAPQRYGLGLSELLSI
ncbi:unnamed protein product, partial [Ectocarpus fasciculatus]